MKFQFGIEHEVAFVRSNSLFADFSNTTYEEFAKIIQCLPEYEDDRISLRMGNLGIRRKRWYIEGIERFDEIGTMVKYIPKGIEIRTTLHPSIDGAIDELKISFDLLERAAKPFGFTPIATSFNPTQTEFIPTPPLNDYERHRMNASPEDRTEHLPMLTYGPDLNLSVMGATVAQSIAWAKKLTYYSPDLLPFSYTRVNLRQNSPVMYDNLPWDGESVRTFYRTGDRPAALVFLDDPISLIKSDPSLTKLTTHSSEVGRIEFKAFDSCGDLDRYASLFALLKGLLIDTTLTEAEVVPDRLRHQYSARYGWQCEALRLRSQRILQAADNALKGDPDRQYLKLLESCIQSGPILAG
jgi:hypothetical protein